MNYKFDKQLADTIYRLCHAYQKSINGDRVNKEGGKEFDFVASYPKYTAALLTVLNKEQINKGASIVDLGCGLSPVLTYLNHIGFKRLIGIDNEEKYAYALRSVICDSSYNNYTFVGDLLKMNDKLKEVISKARLIYLYMPISDGNLYASMIKDVAKLMKKGAVIMDYYGPIFETLENNTRFKKILFRKKEGMYFRSYYYKKL